MDYKQALRFLYSFTDYERTAPSATDRRPFRLGPFRLLLRRLGNPQGQFHAVHVAGTKGKGSVAAMVERIARAAGCVTGLYTSPHLEDVRERIQVGGDWISEGDFARGLGELKKAVDLRWAGGYRTTFELLTALAFRHFADQRVDVAVVETGLGGLLDSTNVLRPAVAVITPIGVEHAAILGRTLPEVAAQKAGIIKRGIPVVSARQEPRCREVIARRCRLLDAPLVEVGSDAKARRLSAGPDGQLFRLRTPERTYPSLAIPLLGRHQISNAAEAVVAAEALRSVGLPVDAEHVKRGLAQVDWPGRLEFIRGKPTLLLDGAHTNRSLTLLLQFLREAWWFPPPSRRAIVFGMSKDKPAGTMLARLSSMGRRVVLTQSQHPKAAPAEALAPLLPSCNGMEVFVREAPADALALACRTVGEHGMVVVTGSLYLVGDLRQAALRRSRSDAR